MAKPGFGQKPGSGFLGFVLEDTLLMDGCKLNPKLPIFRDLKPKSCHYLDIGDNNNYFAYLFCYADNWKERRNKQVDIDGGREREKPLA